MTMELVQRRYQYNLRLLGPVPDHYTEETQEFCQLPFVTNP